MGIGVQRNAVRPQLHHLAQGAGKRLWRLARQAIDQVHVDRIKTNLARLRHESADLFKRLDAVHGFLHIRIEILHTKTQAVKAKFGQGAQARGIYRPGINLDRIFAARRKGEAAPQHGHQLAQFAVGQEGGRATAQMQLGHRLSRAKLCPVQVNLAPQVAQVTGRPAVVLGDDLVAGAVITKRFAKRNMHIHRQRQGQHGRTFAALDQGLTIVRSAESFDKTVRSRVGRVAGPGNVKSLQQVGLYRGHRRILMVMSDCAVRTSGCA